MANTKKFDLQAWLATIDINDIKWDFVMHRDHWLTCEWSPKCQLCRVKLPSPKKLQLPVNKLPSPILPPTDSTKTTSSLGLTKTSSIPTISYKSDRTLKNTSQPKAQAEATVDLNFTESLVPVTPIRPSNATTKPFLTPMTSNKQFNDTYTRSTRRSTMKQEDLINLNETFDLYKSALADTPGVDG